MSTNETDIPQWKKDLIARLRSQNKRTATAQQLLPPQRTLVPSSSVQQPAAVGSGEKCDCAKMVQERSWEPRNGSCDKSDSDEDLHYGPGIVSKLKERYLSLAQRENKVRPSILRKAASLENILDDAQDTGANRLFQTNRNDTKNATDRYRNAKRGSELKRARSVETISSAEDREVKEAKRESLHEEMLIAKGNELIIPEKPPENANTYTPRVNRPKRIAPVMNEKEKPPADVVKQAKMIFERRPEQRTRPPQQTGEVAARVATFKNIIVQNKVKKPALKVKPVISAEKPKTNGVRAKPKPLDNDAERGPKSPTPKSPPPKSPTPKSPPPKSPTLKSVDLPPQSKPDPSPPRDFTPAKPLDLSPKKTTPSLPSPIPDISRVDFKSEENGVKTTSLTETPDLIITSSPLPVVNSPSFRISATKNFIEEEIRLASSDRTPPTPPKPSKPQTDPVDDVKKPATPQPANSMTFNFAKTAKSQNHVPVNKNVLNTQTPPSQPLKLEINGVNETKKTTANDVKSTGQIVSSAKPNLTNLEIQKNLINKAKTLEQPKSSVITKCADEVTIKVPKVKKPPRELENNTIVFKFTDRKDVPDYVQNDGVRRVAKPEKPKVGEGGIILLPGASIGESGTDEDEELLLSLEGPPSPCDVTFINDNILIDGKSSLSQKTKRAKLKITFVDEGPDVYEYPSENSLLVEDIPTSPSSAQMRHSVPLSGTSSLANYTPKSTEDFQPGVTRSVQNTPISQTENLDTTDLILQEAEKPILFSAGANSDILF